MTVETSPLTNIQDSQFPRHSSEGAAVLLVQSEWLLAPRRQKSMKGWVRDQNCPVPRSLQFNPGQLLQCERPFLKVRRRAPDERGQKKPQNSAIDSILKVKTFEKNKNIDSTLYQLVRRSAPVRRTALTKVL